MDPNKKPPLSPEELQAIGEIQVGPSKHELFLNSHYKKILIGILILGIGSGIGIAFFSQTKDANERAACDIVTIMQAEKPADALSSAEYKQDAINDILKNYPNSPSAPTATLLDGLRLLNSGNSALGIAKLSQIAQDSNSIIIRSRAAAAIANHFMGENKLPEASKAWKAVIGMEQNPYSALAYLNLGDIAKISGDKEGARAYYQSAEKNCSESAFLSTQDISMRLQQLDIDAPQPAAPKPIESAASPDGTTKSLLDGANKPLFQ